MTYFGVKCHDSWNLVSNGSAKNKNKTKSTVCVYIFKNNANT